ncbi:TonB-dependent receptor [Massilia sp. W12]|uniref:TonB-dependent receptor domain-containing protein n=1 Tax=Massilia sp. W12 TaxID=3126507 RepID=UPI0030CB7DA1
MHHPFMRTPCAIAVAAAFLSPILAQAQEKVEKVVITGSNIKRSQVETASPVQTLTRDDILRTGASTVRELLDTVTATASTLSDIGGSVSFASGASGVNLRDLGKASTLVLVNSRRISMYALADGAQVNFANIDTIPVDVVDRVEILKDGASAIYGSDAVAGVINIITKKEFKGIALRAGGQQSLTYGQMDHNRSASITVGHGDLAAQGFNLIGHVELYKRGNYMARDVIKAVEPWYAEYINPNFGVRSTFSYPGNFVGRYPANYSDPALAGKSISQPRPGCAPQNLEGGLCRFDQWSHVEVVPKADRVNGFFTGRKKMSDNLTVFAELQLSKTRTSYNNTPALMQPGSTSTWYDGVNRKVLVFTEPSLPVGHPDNPYSFAIPLRYRYADDTSIFKRVADASQHRLMIGAEGTHFGWDWNMALGNMGSKADVISRGTKHFTNYTAAITSGEYRFGGTNSPELLARMFPEVGSFGKSTETFFDIRGSRELMDMAGGKLAMAAGAELRHETFEMYNSENVRKAEMVGRGSSEVRGSRNLNAAFVELAAPFTKQLEGSFALRADKTSTAPASVVPKFGLRYSAANWVTFRGTYAHGFRSPNLAETGDGATSAFSPTFIDPKRCATGNAMYAELIKGNAVDRSNALTARDSGCSASSSLLVVPSKNLEPEKSKSYTLGVILEPVKNVSILIDYFNIERRNEIDTKSVDQMLASEDLNPGTIGRLPISEQDRQFAARVKELSGKDINFTAGEVADVRLPYFNLNKSRRSGLDVEVDTKWNLGSVGKLRVKLDATWMRDYRGWDTNENTFSENLVGKYDHPKIRAVLSTVLDSGAWSWGTRVAYTSGQLLIDDKYDSNNTLEGCESRGIRAVDCRVAADTVVDASVVYKGIKNTTLTVYLGNVFNRAAVIDVRTSSSAPARGRVLKLAAEYKF